MILDDSFSALDGATEKQVIDNLLGPDGIFRSLRTTVLWVTNYGAWIPSQVDTMTLTKMYSEQYFPLADHIVVLGDNAVKEQGSYESLRSLSGQISKIIHPDSEKVEAFRAKLDGVAKISLQSQALSKLALEAGRKNGDPSLYGRNTSFSLKVETDPPSGYYFKAAGFGNVLLVIGCTASYSFFNAFPQYWLKWWTESVLGETAFYTVGYLLLILMAWISTNGIMW